MGSKGIENESEKKAKDKKFTRKNKLSHIFFQNYYQIYLIEKISLLNCQIHYFDMF